MMILCVIGCCLMIMTMMESDDKKTGLYHVSGNMASDFTQIIRMTMLFYCNCYAICSEIAFRAIVSDPPQLSDRRFLLGRSAD